MKGVMQQKNIYFKRCTSQMSMVKDGYHDEMHTSTQTSCNVSCCLRYLSNTCLSLNILPEVCTVSCTTECVTLPLIECWDVLFDMLSETASWIAGLSIRAQFCGTELETFTRRDSDRVKRGTAEK